MNCSQDTCKKSQQKWYWCMILTKHWKRTLFNKPIKLKLVVSFVVYFSRFFLFFWMKQLRLQLNYNQRMKVCTVVANRVDCQSTMEQVHWTGCRPINYQFSVSSWYHSTTLFKSLIFLFSLTKKTIKKGQKQTTTNQIVKNNRTTIGRVEYFSK